MIRPKACARATIAARNIARAFTPTGLSRHRLHKASLTVFAEQLRASGFGAITSEILPAPLFYYAEDYHQQYLAKNPNGYCGIGGTGVTCPIGLAVT